MHHGVNELTIDFHIRDLSKQSHADIELGARNVDALFESCLSVTTCLKVLGDGSAAGYAIQNRNEIQLSCLEGKIGSSSFVFRKCNKWTRCLSSDQKTKLIV